MENKEYYEIEQIAPLAWKIYEDYQASMYLICGSGRACLIDTGYGGGNLLGVINSLTDLPLTVINTHGHTDHVMGNRLFDRVYLNSADLALYRGTIEEFPEIIRSDEVVEKYGAEIVEQILASAVFPEAENISGGDVINLGGVQLEALALPGHTSGSIALIDRRDGFLFSGDAIIEHLWMFLEDSLPCTDYLAALRAAKEKLGGIEKIYNGHYAWHPLDISFIDKVIAEVESIIDGAAEGKPFENDIGSGTEYFFGDYSIICK